MISADEIMIVRNPTDDMISIFDVWKIEVILPFNAPSLIALLCEHFPMLKNWSRTWNMYGSNLIFYDPANTNRETGYIIYENPDGNKLFVFRAHETENGFVRMDETPINTIEL
jgi:hypothetical protein